ncbi:choline/ethanolamine kinase [Eurosta solidaginis]|uniref:choline/ethanolamine kinase n=1 Tax=Eurosta solidaginis TaxID=178769 RepID=UPI003530AB7A
MSNLKTASIEEIRELAARLCRDYLTGRWKTISPADLTVKKINGGLSNFLYYISLPTNHNNIRECPNNSTASQSSENYVQLLDDNNELISGDNIINNNNNNNKNNHEQLSLAARQCTNEPNEVLLRIYGEAHGDDDALGGMITESVIFALLSERNFGPKLYGIFPGGRLEQYLNARALLTHELAKPKISKKIAEKMAEIHVLNIPVSKEPEWMWNCMDRWLKTVDGILSRSDWGDKKAIVNAIKKIDFRKEMNWLQSVINKGNYKVMFCHNDMQEGNILFANPNSNNTSSDKTNGKRTTHINGTVTHDETYNTDDDDDDDNDEPDLQIIDFEYCAYNYRSFDLANHFIEWTFDYSNPVAPFYYQRKQNYPTKEQRQRFYIAYLRKINESLPKYMPTQQELDSMDDEVRLFSMFSHLHWGMWSIVMTLATIEFGYWEYGADRLLEYQQIKSTYESGAQAPNS